MQLLSMWTFGWVALITIAVFGGSYLLRRQIRKIKAWADSTDPPKEKVVFYLPVNLILGLVFGGFVQSLYDAGSMCNQRPAFQKQQEPMIQCTLKSFGQPSNQGERL